MGSEQPAGAVLCDACVKEQTRAQESRAQVRRTRRDKQEERGRRQKRGLPCKAGMRAKGKNPLPRENLVTHLDRTTPYRDASVRMGRPSDTLGTAVPSCHRQRPRLPGPWTIQVPEALHKGLKVPRAYD
jgi:hypothetical protein